MLISQRLTRNHKDDKHDRITKNLSSATTSHHNYRVYLQIGKHLKVHKQDN